ncbi:MAG: hydroxymethylbilane synthase [Gammaproteobacteria bacterium]|jgi:hydroxymethylbilane synthase|nr:hydroxymethylbilane synthase [Gammaproteobacteria bacterium]
MMKTLRIATRQSPLALWQANFVKDQLLKYYPDLQIELLPLVTKGDALVDQSLIKFGGKGLFVKELEKALLDKKADLAVHSSKDLPAKLPDGLCLGAVYEREDPRDALVTPHADKIESLPKGAVIGTSSLRRQCQLAHHYPHLQFKLLRGNVDTRLKKLEAGQYDAIILAAAGLIRLGLRSKITAYLDVAQCLPAVGQGILAIECREEDNTTHTLIRSLENSSSRICLSAERACSEALGGSCQVPVAAYATLKTQHSETVLQLQGLVGKPDGTVILRHTLTGSPNEAVPLGRALAKHLAAEGAEEIIRECLQQ